MTDNRSYDWRIRTPSEEKNALLDLPINKLISPDVGIFDEPTRCYKINHEWAKIVIGIVSLLADTRMWKDAYEDDFPAIQSVLEFLEGGVCVNCDEILQCITADPNQQALATALYTSYLEDTASALDTIESDYDGTTAQSAFSNIPVTAADLDPDHLLALCWSLYSWSVSYQAAKSAAVSGGSGVLGLWQKLVNIGKDVYGSLKQTLVGVWDSLLGSVSSTDASLALGSTSAAEDLACCLFQQLRVVSVDEVSFVNALNSCSASLSGDGQILASLIASTDGASTRSYLSWLQVYSVALDRVAGGDQLSCICDKTFSWWYDINNPYPITPLPNWSFDVSLGQYGYVGGALAGYWSTEQPALFGTDYVLDMGFTIPDKFVTEVRVSSRGSWAVSFGSVTVIGGGVTNVQADDLSWGFTYHSINAVCSSLVVRVVWPQASHGVAMQGIEIDWL